LELGGSGSAGNIRGTLTINSGATARLTGTDALGYQSGTAVTQVNINGGTLDAATTGNNGLIANFSLTGGTVSGTGRMDFSTGYGITTLASGTSSVFSAPMMLRDGNNMSINVADGEASTDLLFSGAIVEQNDNSGITKSSDGTLSLTGNNTYSGTTTVSGGTLAFSGGTNSLGNASVNNGTLTFSGNAAVTMSSIGVQDWQTVQFQDNADVTLSSGLSVSHLASRFNLFGGTLRTPSIAGSMVVWQMNLGSIHLAGTRIVATADNDNFITLNGWESWNVIFVKPEGAIFDTAGHDIGIHYTLANEGGAGTLTKLGAGTLTLYAGDSYAGIYSGPTTVSNGTLLVNGTIGNSAVSVASGATLGGTSTLAGAVTLESGAMLAPGAATNQIGTLTLSGTAPALSGCGLVADVSATSGVCDLLALSGAADLTGLTVTVKTTGTLPSANTYVLISSTGTLSGTPTLAGDLPSSAWRLSVKNGNALVLEKIVGTMILLY
ncbi:MAG: autotransporter-associated beta strand repeat-containing protein, partial [bacterium]